MKIKNLSVILALILVFCAMLTGCSRGSEAKVVNDKDMKVMYIKAEVKDAPGKAEAVVRKMQLNKQTKQYETEKEYEVLKNSQNNDFIFTVYEKGMYEIEFSCKGYKTATVIAEVNENKTYSVIHVLEKE